MFIEFLKNILAKLLPITTDIPHPLIETGACSLLLPHPKFSPATIISPFLTFFANSGLIVSKQWEASSFSSVVIKYLAAIISSVFILSPNFLFPSYLFLQHAF